MQFNAKVAALFLFVARFAAGHLLRFDSPRNTESKWRKTMSFNYAKEKRKFDEEWTRLQEQYSKAGMSAEAIAQMKAFDWGWFCSRRVYDWHTQSFPEEAIRDEDAQSNLFRKFAALSVTFDAVPSGRYGWIEAIEDENLYGKIHTLSPNDLELITLYFAENYDQMEIAVMQGCDQSTVSRRLQKIIRFLKLNK